MTISFEDARALLAPLAKGGIKLPALTQAAELAANSPIPPELAYVDAEEAAARMNAAAKAGPAAVLDEITSIERARSGSAQQARAIAENARDNRVVELVESAAPAIDKALSKALRDAKARVVDCERALIPFKLTAPRLVSGGQVTNNAGPSLLRAQAAQHSPAALEASNAWTAAHAQFKALSGLGTRVRQLGLLGADSLVAKQAGQPPAPLDMAGRVAEAEKLARVTGDGMSAATAFAEAPDDPSIKDRVASAVRDAVRGRA